MRSAPDLRVQSVYTVAVGVIAVLFAVMLQLLFRRQDRPFGAHLVFALHFVSFMYLLTIAAGASRAIGLSVDAAAAALLVFTTLLNALANFAAIRLTLALV